jgi:carbohydrate kinase (thermoresistant glucokinase family)
MRHHSDVVVIVMGPAGAGKSTVGQALARELGWAFTDADDLHAATSVAKMQQGIGLEDDERWPWLGRVKAVVDAADAAGQPCVVACSALRERYRAYLGGGRQGVTFVYLDAPADVLAARLRHRQGHFAAVDLLQSQLEALEPPQSGVVVDATRPVDAVVREIRGALTL